MLVAGQINSENKSVANTCRTKANENGSLCVCAVFAFIAGKWDMWTSEIRTKQHLCRSNYKSDRAVKQRKTINDCNNSMMCVRALCKRTKQMDWIGKIRRGPVRSHDKHGICLCQWFGLKLGAHKRSGPRTTGMKSERSKRKNIYWLRIRKAAHLIGTVWNIHSHSHMDSFSLFARLGIVAQRAFSIRRYSTTGATDVVAGKKSVGWKSNCSQRKINW